MALTTTVTTGSPPLSIPVIAVDVVSSAMGYSKKGRPIHTNESKIKRGISDRSTIRRAEGMQANAKAPKKVRAIGTTGVAT
jgi:hypothetical protein